MVYSILQIHSCNDGMISYSCPVVRLICQTIFHVLPSEKAFNLRTSSEFIARFHCVLHVYLNLVELSMNYKNN